KEYFNLANSYGTFPQHRAMLEALLQNGAEPVADIVINHRDGSTHWADFRNPDWGTWAITRDDEAFSNPDSEVFNTPVNQRGAAGRDDGRPPGEAGRPQVPRESRHCRPHEGGGEAGERSRIGPMPEQLGSGTGLRVHPHASGPAVGLLEALLRLGHRAAEQDP